MPINFISSLNNLKCITNPLLLLRLKEFKGTVFKRSIERNRINYQKYFGDI